MGTAKTVRNEIPGAGSDKGLNERDAEGFPRERTSISAKAEAGIAEQFS